MSPTATRTSRASKPKAKPVEHRTATKRAAPSARKAAVGKPVARTKPASKPEPKLKKPVKSTAPIKKSLVAEVERLKKTIIEGTVPEAKSKAKAAKAEKEAESVKKAAKAEAKPAEHDVRPVSPPEPEPESLEEEAPKKKRGRKPKSETGEKPVRARSGRPPKAKPLDPIEEFLAEDIPAPEEIEEDAVIPEDLAELDPLDIPLVLLDPELVEVPRPVGPTRPKPKPRVERHPKQCASCGQMFTWLSVDQLCFNCLKRKLAAKKREDEAYGGYTETSEEDDND